MKKKPTKRKKVVVNRFPPGWTEAKVREVIDYYDHQTEGEAVAEAESSLARQRETVMDVPIELVPAVRGLIAKHQRAREARK
jgi:hypothetical protein